ncbi:recombinase, partial [Streptomyces sp. NPDC094468]
MSERVVPGHPDGLVSLAAADALWVDLTAGGAVPTAPGACALSPAHGRVGCVLLGSRVVPTVRAGVGLWGVAEIEVHRAAADLNAVVVEQGDLVRVGPFRRRPGQPRDLQAPLRWRQRITEEVQRSGT